MFESQPWEENQAKWLKDVHFTYGTMMAPFIPTYTPKHPTFYQKYIQTLSTYNLVFSLPTRRRQTTNIYYTMEQANSITYLDLAVACSAKGYASTEMDRQ